jgi:C-terminal processing protease CtpA/Prc
MDGGHGADYTAKPRGALGTAGARWQIRRGAGREDEDLDGAGWAGRAQGTDGVGVGIGIVADGDALQVVRMVPGSGAFDAGIELGDYIVAIDGVPVTRLGVDRAFASLRGQPGTTVALTLRRDERYIQLVVERRPLRS